jgi:hypothetical protein
MNVALGFKAHSGWAALVAIGISGSEFQVIDRRRLELVEPRDSVWAKQPYHAAETLELKKARDLVKRGADAAHRMALKQMRATVQGLERQSHQIVACAVLMPSPMPEWTTEEILAVHFRMHKAEGVLFPDALASAAEACGLKLVAIPEKTLIQIAQKTLGKPASELAGRVVALGKAVGPPWTKDQKNATLAAMVALQDLK